MAKILGYEKASPRLANSAGLKISNLQEKFEKYGEHSNPSDLECTNEINFANI
jgi:hypothetical protein